MKNILTYLLLAIAACASAKLDGPEMYEEGDIMHQDGEPLKWFTVEPGKYAMALSMTGITPGEYELYRYACEISGHKPHTVEEMKEHGIFLLDEHEQDADSWGTSLKMSDDWLKNMKSTELFDPGPGCYTVAGCLAKASNLCTTIWTHVAKEAIKKLKPGEKFTNFFKHPITVAVTTAGVTGPATYYAAFKASGGPSNGGFEPAKTCQAALSDLKEVLGSVVSTCHAKAESNGTCIDICSAALVDPENSRHDTFSIEVTKKGGSCPKNPPCNASCHD